MENRDVQKKLELLESRLARLESKMGMLEKKVPETQKGFTEEFESDINFNFGLKSLSESSIGEYGLAWLGNVVLLFGVIFLAQYINGLGYSLASAASGYVMAFGVLLVSYLIRNSHTNMSYLFSINGQFLVFYMTLRLHFFTPDPMIQSKPLALVLLILVIVVLGYYALQKKSQLLSGITIVYVTVLAIASDSTHFMLPLAVVASAISIYLLYLFSWKRIAILTLILSYVCFLLWIINNPIMGNPIGIIEHHQHGILYLYLIGGIYSIVPLFRNREDLTEGFVFGLMVLNGFLFSLMILMVTAEFFESSYVPLFSVITLFCLLYSMLLHSLSSWKFTSAFFALFGFVAMTVAIYGLYNLPRAYFLLSIQSLLVVSMALWFRNKIIIYMNTALFSLLLLVYLTSPEYIDNINVSFAIVALVTARILNWKRHRLDIKTDFIRNTYLVFGFFSVLFALYHLFQPQYITLSWSGAALVYFCLSLLLKNVKYRYLALGTVLAAAFYLFVFDMARIDILYRVLAFLFLAIISIGVSIYYSRKTKHTSE